MEMRFPARILAVAIVAALCGAAHAQPRIPGSGGDGGTPASGGDIIQGTSPELTLERVKEAGYDNAQVYTARSGRKHVSGSISGMPVSIIHQNCRDDLCPILVFLINFGKQPSIDAAYMNAWNRDKLYTSLYVDKEGTLWFAMSVFVSGVSPQYLTSISKIYAGMLKQVLEYKPE